MIARDLRMLHMLARGLLLVFLPKVLDIVMLPATLLSHEDWLVAEERGSRVCMFHGCTWNILERI